MDRRFNGSAEARSHIDAVRAQRQRRGKPAPVAKATAGDHGNRQLVGSGGDQDQAWNIILARMPGTLKPVDRNRVHAHPLRRQGVTHRRAFMDDDDAMRLEMVDMLLRLVPGGLHDLHAAIDDRLAIFGIGRRVDRRQDGEVHPKRLVGHRAATVDFAAQIVGRWLGQRGQYTKAACIGDCGGQFCPANPHHPALDDRMLDPAQIGEARPDPHYSASTIVTLATPPPSHIVCRP